MQATKELTVFKDKRLRIEMVEGEPYFCVKDICDELELQSEEVQRRLRNSEMFNTHPGIMATIDTETETGRRAMAYVNEMGLYEIIGNSRKPKSRELFQQIIFALPALRQNNNELNDLKDRIAKLERGGGHLLIKPVPEISARSRLNMIIRKFVARQTSGYSYEDAWNELYYQDVYRNHRYIKQSAKNRKLDPLTYAENHGLIESLVDLATYIFRPVENL